MQSFGIVSAVLAFLLALIAGYIVLSQTEFDLSKNALVLGVGFYFLAKAIFVGAQLILSSRK